MAPCDSVALCYRSSDGSDTDELCQVINSDINNFKLMCGNMDGLGNGVLVAQRIWRLRCPVPPADMFFMAWMNSTEKCGQSRLWSNISGAGQVGLAKISGAEHSH